jgi:hypothetical protein
MLCIQTIQILQGIAAENNPSFYCKGEVFQYTVETMEMFYWN